MSRYLASALACALFVSVPLSNKPLRQPSTSEFEAAADSVSADETDAIERLPPAFALRREIERARSSIRTLIAGVGRAIEAEIGKESDAKIDAESEQTEPRLPLTREAICQVLHEAAAEHDLPTPLFTRLIWQESRFRTYVVSRAGAQGIAQFMPGTAAERGLEDPFDPIQALPASAEFLRDLIARFGNFGLAAAAYNGGPGRVSRWLSGRGGLPKETRDYVIHITGRTAEHWAKAGDEAKPHPEATDVRGCDVAPLRTALAEIRAQEQAQAAERAAEERKKAIARAQATWIALLTGNWTQQRAHTVYARLQKKYPKDLGSHKPVVRVAKAKSKDKTPTVQVRLVADSREEAEQLCKRLKEAGGSCAVKKDPT